MKKIAYLFTSGRKARLEEEKKGFQIPHDFFFGATLLDALTYEIDLFELDDFSKSQTEIQNRIYSKYKFTGLTSCSNLIDSEKINKLNEYDLIIASNEYIALGVYDFVKKGVLTKPFIFFVMGMLSKTVLLKGFNLKKIIKYQLGKFLYKGLIRTSESAVFIGEGECQIAKEIFPKLEQKIKFIPFPVDTDFWYPSDIDKEDYILFIGNDMRRDFDMLLEIAKSLPEEEFVVISQRFKNISIPKNMKLIQGDWKKKKITDIGIRDYVRNASMVTLPLLETYQPSGQSVAQQAMACGKPVLISKTKGFWDSEQVKNRQHLVFIPIGNLSEWVSTIKELKKDTFYRQKIGENACFLMKKKFNLFIFTKSLSEIISSIKL